LADIFVFGLDSLACFVLILLFVFFFLEIFWAPGVFAERGLVYGAGIDDYAGFNDGLEVDSAEVRRRGLQSVEQEAGGFGVYFPA
jgi:hypothetical protein